MRLERIREDEDEWKSVQTLTVIFRWVIKVDNYYYMTYTTNDNITILRSPVLT